MIGRDNRIDNIKGSLMLLVIFGHMIEPLLNYNPALSRVYNFIYLFHIPAFVFLSGLMSGAESKDLPEKIVKGLAIPLVFFSLIYEIPDLILRSDLSGYIKSLTPNWILWFLVSLIAWRIITPVLIKFRFILFWAILFSILVSLIKVDGYLYGAFRTIIFYPFYLIGVTLSSKKGSIKEVNLNKFIYVAAVLLMLTVAMLDLPFSRYLLYCVAPFNAFGYSNETGMLQRAEYYVFSALLVISFSIFASAIKLVGVIGRNSIFVYLWHGLIVKYFLWVYVVSIKMTTSQALLAAFFASVILGYSLSSRPVVTLTNRMLDMTYRIFIKKIKD